MVGNPENTSGITPAAIKASIAKTWTLMNGYYFSKAALKIVHFKG